VVLLRISNRILRLFFICYDHSGMYIPAKRLLLFKDQMKSLRCCWVSYLLPLLLRFLIIMDPDQSPLSCWDFQRALASLKGDHRRDTQ